MLHTNGKIIEYYTADSVRKKEELTLKQWALRFDELLNYVRIVYSPSLIILVVVLAKNMTSLKNI